MQPQTSTTHTAYFNALINKLAVRYQPLQIFNFSQSSFVQQNSGCFFSESSAQVFNYCLLLVTESKTRIDYDVQEFVNTDYKQGTITVICHCRQSIEEAIAANNRFFKTIYHIANLVYSQNGMLLANEVPAFIPTHAATKARKHYRHRFSISEGFYLGASECLSNWEQYSVCVFMLHQAVEQLCIGLIRIHMAYRSEFHNLSRLLNLCTCFSYAPLQLFSATAEDRRLFSFLSRSYSAARYQADFEVSKKDAISLCDKVSDFTALATQLCEEKIEALSRLTKAEV